MVLSDVTIIKGEGGLGWREPGEDHVCGLLVQGLPVAPSPGIAGVNLQEVHTLFSLKDAEDLGLTDDYDKANGVLVWYHIKEYFRLNRSGELWLLLADPSMPWWTMVDASFSQANAKRLLLTAAGRIRQLGVAFNPPFGYFPFLSDGLDNQLFTTIAKAQELASEEFALHRPLQILLEGRSFNGSPSGAMLLRGFSAPSVSLTIGADFTPAFRDSLALDYGGNANVLNHAALGTLLGQVSRMKVNQNVGWVAQGNIQSGGAFLAPGLSSNLPISYYSDLNVLNERGYIFLRQHTGIAGVYFNDSHTCTLVSSDYYCIENNRVMNKAARLVRTALLPFVNSPVVINKDGTVDRAAIAYFQNAGAAALRPMFTDGEIPTEADVFIDTRQNVLATSELQVQFAIVPTGTARQIKAFVNFKNPFQSLKYV